MHKINERSFGEECLLPGHHNCEFIEGNDGHHAYNESVSDLFPLRLKI